MDFLFWIDQIYLLILKFVVKNLFIKLLSYTVSGIRMQQAGKKINPMNNTFFYLINEF